MTRRALSRGKYSLVVKNLLQFRYRSHSHGLGKPTCRVVPAKRHRTTGTSGRWLAFAHAAFWAERRLIVGTGAEHDRQIEEQGDVGIGCQTRKVRVVRRPVGVLLVGSRCGRSTR